MQNNQIYFAIQTLSNYYIITLRGVTLRSVMETLAFVSGFGVVRYDRYCWIFAKNTHFL